VVHHQVLRVGVAAVVGLTAISGCSSGPVTRVTTSQQSRLPSPASSAPASQRSGGGHLTTIVAAGDISVPGSGAQKETSDLVLRLDPTRVLVLGDDQYGRGSLSDFEAFYGPTWGRFKSKTDPAPGNHEYMTPDASGYFAYFGAAARPQGHSYYSFDLGGWHIVSLDSNIARGGGSAQLRWLTADLGADRQRCTLAFWHHPRFSSGTTHGDDPSVGAFWDELSRAHADVVLNGHEHNYERFAPQDPHGHPRPDGVREFVVGTGGNATYPFGRPEPTSEKRITATHGVLQMVLQSSGYQWRFVSTTGETLDAGTSACH
jgi:Calcineurin-like phosphoesterase